MSSKKPQTCLLWSGNVSTPVGKGREQENKPIFIVELWRPSVKCACKMWQNGLGGQARLLDRCMPSYPTCGDQGSWCQSLNCATKLEYLHSVVIHLEYCHVLREITNKPYCGTSYCLSEELSPQRPCFLLVSWNVSGVSLFLKQNL